MEAGHEYLFQRTKIWQYSPELVRDEDRVCSLSVSGGPVLATTLIELLITKPVRLDIRGKGLLGTERRAPQSGICPSLLG